MKYSYPVVETEILNDHVLLSTLELLMSEKSPAKILAVEYPFHGAENATPSRVLVAHGDRGALLLPWYSLADDRQINDKQMMCIAEAFRRQSYHYSLNIFEHRSQVMGSPDNCALLLGPGFGALVRSFDREEDEDFIGDLIISSDADLQRKINLIGAVVLPEMDSNHARMAHAPKLDCAIKLINQAHSIYDPRTNDRIWPGAKMPNITQKEIS